MNKSQPTQKQSKDIFEIYQNATVKMFDEVNQIVSRYHQSIANTQQEIIKSWEGNITAAINAQKEFTVKSGIPATIPDAGVRAVNDTAEGYIKMATVGNQMILATIDATQQGIKTANENVKALNDLNRNTIRSWATAFTGIN